MESVHLLDSNGKTLSTRSNARKYFCLGRRMIYWDDLDMSYFANYAFWNYFTLPALLLNQEITWSQVDQSTLKAIFPPSIPTHSRVQHFHFNEDGLLLQHDYCADVISRFAQAANVVTEHKKNGQITYPARRIVTPRTPWGKPMAGPVLIDIQVHQFSLLDH